MDRQKFFDAARPIFNGGKLTADQVKGMEAILDAVPGMKVSFVAYLLATAFHETGQRMQSVTESFNYAPAGLLNTFGKHRITEAQAKRYGRTNSQPANQEAIANTVYGGGWGLTNLGNSLPGDGWRYRGAGLVQITGRANFRKFGLEDRPQDAMKLATAVQILVTGCVNGVFTGKRLSDYLPGNYRGARAVVNADVAKNGELIAGYARKFEAALNQAGWRGTLETTATKPTAPAAPVAPVSGGGFLSAILSLLQKVFK